MAGKKVNSGDIARIAGVSRATVSYVINDRADQTISASTRARVHRAVEETGYRPNSAARTLATGKSFTTSLWLPSSTHSVYGQVVKQVVGLAKADGYHLAVVHLNGETPETLCDARQVNASDVDGIIALDATATINTVIGSSPLVAPIVSIGPAYSTKVDHVGVDLGAGSLLAMRHLVDQGCRKIGFLVQSFHQCPGDPRFDAYVRVMAEIGGEFDFLPMDKPVWRDAYVAVKKRFAERDRPDSLFCFNDECAIAANKAISELGLRVPEDVAIIGSDGIDETDYAIPSISTVAQPFATMCSLAWKFLLNRMSDPSLPTQSALLPMTLEARGSSLKRILKDP